MRLSVFLTAAHRMSVPPKRCVVWEDAPAGVLAAKAASMACVAVPEPGEGNHPAFGLADLVVDSLERVGASSLRLVARDHFGGGGGDDPFTGSALPPDS